jgi:hypothetical protein
MNNSATRALLFLFTLFNLAGAAVPASAASYNIAVTGIEISQGVQNLANEMPLVRGRRTIVRVYVRETTGQTIEGVDWALTYEVTYGTQEGGGGYGGGGTTLPATVKPDGGSRLEWSDSLNSLVVSLPIPGDIDDSQPALLEVTAEVNPDHWDEELDSSDNTLTLRLPLQIPDPLHLHFVPAHTHAQPSTEEDEVDPEAQVFEYQMWSDPKDLQIALGALRKHPVADLDQRYLISWQKTPVYPIDHEADVEWNLFRSEDRYAINERLEAAEDLAGASEQLIYYGMLDPAVYGCNADGCLPAGWAIHNEASGFMLTSGSPNVPWWHDGNSTLGHEIGHLRGRPHVLCQGNEASGGGIDESYPWPRQEDPYVPCRLAEVDPEGYYGLDVYYGWHGLAQPAVIGNDPDEPHPHRGFPLMGYKFPGWISPYEYCKMFPAYGMVCGLPWPDPPEPIDDEISIPGSADPPAVEALRTASAYLRIGGLLRTAAEEALLPPFYRFEEISEYQLERAIARRREEAAAGWATSFFLDLVDAAGGVLYEHPIHTAARRSDGAEAPSDVVALSDLLPFPAGTATLRLRAGTRVLAERPVSANPPTVTILSPAGGESLEVGDTIRWNAADADGDDLTSTILYSADDGNTWTVLALEVGGSLLEVDQDLLDDMAGSARARIEVLVSDGVLTASDVSGGAFATPNQAPIAGILVAPGQPVTAGEPVVFEGMALDKEEGQLAGDAVTWSSSVGGVLGSGTRLETCRLSAGRHVITLTAVDSDGAVAEARVTVEVEP